MPLEQVSNSVTFYAMYVASKVGKTGLTVTVDVYRVNTSATATQVVTGDRKSTRLNSSHT